MENDREFRSKLDRVLGEADFRARVAQLRDWAQELGLGHLPDPASEVGCLERMATLILAEPEGVKRCMLVLLIAQWTGYRVPPGDAK